jgi:hypothetical protein
MKLVDFAWNALCNVSGADQNKFRLLLREDIFRPSIEFDEVGYVVSIPVPRIEREGLASIQGLYADMDDRNWSVIWRLFRASLYHAAFHIRYSDMSIYSQWLKGKRDNAAVFTVSLVEDYRITLAAMKQWSALMVDVAFANYIGAIRMKKLGEMGNDATRFACNLLLSMWGMKPKEENADDSKELYQLAQIVQDNIDASVQDVGMISLIPVLDKVYVAVSSRGDLTEVPTFPHTESYSEGNLFYEQITESNDAPRLLMQALKALGFHNAFADTRNDIAEFKDALYSINYEKQKQEKIVSSYKPLVDKTFLNGIVFPQYDYATFLRVKASMAGAIRNVKNSLLQYKNVLDDDTMKESGQINLQLAIQIIASKSRRSDVFDREEQLLKDEAWAILIDTSKSAARTSLEAKSISVCLAEVANELIGDKNKWAMYGFNDTLQVVKDFIEPYSIEQKARIGGLTQQGATLLPDAIQAVSRNLMQRPIENQFLVVISDCLPTGYPRINEKLAEVIEDISKKGVMLIGIGIKNANVKKYFRVSSVLTTPYDMMKFFVRAYMELSGVSS